MVRFARFYFAAPAFIDLVAASLPIHVGRITRRAGAGPRHAKTPSTHGAVHLYPDNSRGTRMYPMVQRALVATSQRSKCK